VKKISPPHPIPLLFFFYSERWFGPQRFLLDRVSPPPPPFSPLSAQTVSAVLVLRDPHRAEQAAIRLPSTFGERSFWPIAIVVRFPSHSPQFVLTPFSPLARFCLPLHNEVDSLTFHLVFSSLALPRESCVSIPDVMTVVLSHFLWLA